MKQNKKLQEKEEKLNNKLKEEEIEYKYKSKLSRFKFETYTKNLVAVIIAVCLIDLQFTYVLAWFDKMQIAESLSSNICTTIIGVALVYMIRAYFDTKAEKAAKNGYDTESGVLKNISNIVKNHANNVSCNNTGTEFTDAESVNEDEMVE